MLSSDGGRSTISRPEEPLTAGNLTLTACVAGTKHRSTLRVWPGCSALRLAGGVAFFAGRGGGPEPRVVQDPFHRVGADQRHPVVGFRQLSGKAFLAPIGMCAPQRQHLLGHRRRCAVGRFRSRLANSANPGKPAPRSAASSSRTSRGPHELCDRPW